MPRKARYFIPKTPVHMVSRGNSRKTIFAEKEDYQYYLQLLLEISSELDCQIYSYVLMTNHVHLLLREANNFLIFSKCYIMRYIMKLNNYNSEIEESIILFAATLNERDLRRYANP